MVIFEWMQDVEEWLEPLGYDEFWREIKRYSIYPADKEQCDMMIVFGEVTEEELLGLLKCIARVELCRILGLKYRQSDVPEFSLH